MDRALEGRTLRVNRPWATAEQRARRIFRLAYFIVLAQFALNGLEQVLSGPPMMGAWFLTGFLVAAGTVRIEKWIFRHVRGG